MYYYNVHIRTIIIKQNNSFWKIYTTIWNKCYLSVTHYSYTKNKCVNINAVVLLLYILSQDVHNRIKSRKRSVGGNVLQDTKRSMFNVPLSYVNRLLPFFCCCLPTMYLITILFILWEFQGCSGKSSYWNLMVLAKNTVLWVR